MKTIHGRLRSKKFKSNLRFIPKYLNNEIELKLQLQTTKVIKFIDYQYESIQYHQFLPFWQEIPNF